MAFLFLNLPPNFFRMGWLKYNFEHHIDSVERTLEHRKLIKNKPFLHRIYLDWYNWFLKIIPELPQGKIIELGSGGGFLKELAPQVICSDLIDLPHNDLTFSALDMPFEENEISGILMVDTFHHIPDAEKFLAEAVRVMKPGAEILMIEPANSIFGRFIYKNFHHEPFYPKGTWKIEPTGPLSGANGALPWIVFERDRKKMEKLFPSLKIISIRYHSPFIYLFSGGVSYKQILPSKLYPLVKFIDNILTFFSKHFSMFVSIRLQKNLL
ncbi:MAG: class I SAM-dependent methyltransferase [Bacteroidales bacterium]